MEIKALFVDAAGTLLKPREPVGVTYARHARKFGYDVDPTLVEARFRTRPRADVIQHGDGRAYWSPIVAHATGCDDPRVFESLYQWYAGPRAWWIDTAALSVLGDAARSGVRLGIISNWDVRLRSLYERFALDRMFPILICSAEVELEKPDPAIFHLACDCAGVRPGNAVHVGDDPVMDVAGAIEAGMTGLHYDDDLGWSELPKQLERLRRPFFGMGGQRRGTGTISSGPG